MSDQVNVGFQETEGGGGGRVDFATVNHFLMVMRNNFSTSSNTPDADDRCISSTSKRQSPSSLFLEEPKSKKVALHNSPVSTHAVGGSPTYLRGFTRLPLPNASQIVWEPPVAASPAPPTPTLRHTDSDMAGAMAPCFRDYLAIPGGFMSNLSPEKASSSASANFPSVMPPLYRSSSAPIPESYLPSMSSPPDSTRRESPTSQRLKRMKEKMKEMSRWWNEVIREGEEEDGLPENKSSCDPRVEEEEEEAVHETEEGVSVEKTKKGLKVQIKCPCGKGYRVFFSGKNCYYQLI